MLDDSPFPTPKPEPTEAPTEAEAEAEALEKAEGQPVVRLVGYVLFITSVAGYAYAAQYLWTQLLAASPYDDQLYYYVFALAVCWVGSVLLMWKWFRFYQNYRPGFGSLLLSLLPILILPLAWGMLQLIKYVEVTY